MSTPSEKLAESLEHLHQLQGRGIVAIRSRDLTRTHRERLCRNGFLQEVIKGWYIAASPDETAGESTTWYTSFWSFCATYLENLRGKEWCLSPEQSLFLHADDWTVPKQLLIRATKARNNITTLPHRTSLLEIRSTLPQDRDRVVRNGLHLYTLPAALIACGPAAYKQKAINMRAVLSTVHDASEVLNRLLDGGHSTVAGRLAGAFRHIGHSHVADDISGAMRAAGYQVREHDPFEKTIPIFLPTRERSPYASRIQLMWQEMREHVIKYFPVAPGTPENTNAYLEHVGECYATDAWHSLSIEGYRVSEELIEKVRSGDWNPDRVAVDKQQHDAMAARGYWQAYQAVLKSIEKVFRNKNSGDIAKADHSIWYREMFAPGVAAGIFRPSDLAGYRNMPVSIRKSMHVPPNNAAVHDAMPVLFELLRKECEPSVRVVLGHFMFVYIHPYTDGNGRMGRFLMNVMLASGGYPWIVVPVEQRDAYMTALEEASVNQNIIPFAAFLSQLLR